MHGDPAVTVVSEPDGLSLDDGLFTSAGAKVASTALSEQDGVTGGRPGRRDAGGAVRHRPFPRSVPYGCRGSRTSVRQSAICFCGSVTEWKIALLAGRGVTGKRVVSFLGAPRVHGGGT